MRLRHAWWLNLLLLVTALAAPGHGQTELINANVLIAGHTNACTSGPTGTTGNAYACSFARPLAMLQPQACHSFVADVANTGPATVNYQALGAKPIVKAQGGITTPLVANDIRPGMLVHTCYDGTNHQCQNCTGNVPTGGSGTPAGSPGQAQFNQTGAFGGSSGLTLTPTHLAGVNSRVTAFNANATLGPTDGPVLACTSGAGTVTATLPPAASTTQGHFRLVKVDAGLGTCQLVPNGADLLNGGSAPKSATTPWAYVEADVVAANAWSVTSGETTAPLVKVASGTLALATTAIASGTCAAVQTAAAPGTLTTDLVLAGFQGDPTATTGFLPSTNGMLSVIPFPTTNTVSVRVCNTTLSSITPGVVTITWKVVR